jgi:sugar phosphate isomerase/epimerase
VKLGQRFGICEWAFPVSGPLAIRLAKEAGYEGIQLGEAGGRKMGYPLKHPQVLEIYRETAKQCGVTLHSLNLGALLAEGTLNYAKDTEAGAFARESLRIGFEVCRKLAVRTIVITVDAKTEEAFKNTVSNLKFAGRLAKDGGVEIAVESALPLDRIQRILASSDETLKVCMDILNPLRFGTGDPREQILAFGKDKISHFHMKDSISGLFRPEERGCTLLGEGDAGYEESVKIIKSLSYEGWMMTENYYYLPPMNHGNDDFVKLAKRDLETMRHSMRDR